MIIELLVVVVIVAARVRLGTHDKSTVESPAEDGADVAVERARAVVGWAEGTGVDWDRHVRPVLARELAELTRGRRVSGERMLGPELWAWVDPDQAFGAEPGPGRAGLTRVLDRLERL